MMRFIERFIRPVREVGSEAQALAVLRMLCAELGFRSVFLIEYTPDLADYEHLLDTDERRAEWMATYFRHHGLARSVKAVEWMLARGTVVKLTEERFPPDDQFVAQAREYDFAEGLAVPISLSESVGGLLSFSGPSRLTATEEGGLHVIAYSLMAQVRAMRSDRASERFPGITPRERQVFTLTAQGLTSPEIAEMLGMSPRTVNQHVDNVAIKFGTKNRVHTVAELVRNNLLN